MQAAELIEHYADEVYGLCRALVRDPVAAEDLSQDTFTRAFRALEDFRGDSSPRTWILTIARNRCYDHLRAMKRQPWGDEGDEAVDQQPAREPRIDDILARRGEVAGLLEGLAESERAMVVLRFGHELGYPELAATFGVKEGTARMRVSRAVAKMREAMHRTRAGATLDATAAPTPAGPALPLMPGAAPAPAPPGAPPAPAPSRATPRRRRIAPATLGRAGGRRASNPLAARAPKRLLERLAALL